MEIPVPSHQLLTWAAIHFQKVHHESEGVITQPGILSQAYDQQIRVQLAEDASERYGMVW